MKLKQSFRYQLADYKAGILVYYCAMLGLLALFLVSTVVDTGVTVVFSACPGSPVSSCSSAACAPSTTTCPCTCSTASAAGPCSRPACW